MIQCLKTWNQAWASSQINEETNSGNSLSLSLPLWILSLIFSSFLSSFSSSVLSLSSVWSLLITLAKGLAGISSIWPLGGALELWVEWVYERWWCHERCRTCLWPLGDAVLTGNWLLMFLPLGSHHMNQELEIQVFTYYSSSVFLLFFPSKLWFIFTTVLAELCFLV